MNNEEIEMKTGDLSIAANLPPQWKKEHDDAIAAAGAIVACANDYDARSLGAVMKRIKDCKKIVHDERMNITRRMDAMKKQLMSRENDICALLSAEETRLAKIGADYATAKAAAEAAARKAEESARVAAAEQDAAEALLTGEAAEPPPPAPAEEPKKPLVAGVRTHRVVVPSVVDADAVPRAYCSPDMALVRAYVQSVKDANPNWDASSFSILGISFAVEVRV